MVLVERLVHAAADKVADCRQVWQVYEPRVGDFVGEAPQEGVLDEKGVRIGHGIEGRGRVLLPEVHDENLHK